MTITYLGHSAFLVKTERRYLLFDPIAPLDFAQFGDLPVTCFASHAHHDHYSQALHEASQSFANVSWILGDIKSRLPRATVMKGRESRRLEGLAIHSAGSTDAGVCFLVEADGHCLFHAGDNADWGDPGDEKTYHREIDYLAKLGKAVDAAFLPVCTFSGQRPVRMTAGIFYAMDALRPRLTIPMHGNGREYLYREFAREAEEKGYHNIHCFQQEGERMEV